VYAEAHDVFRQLGELSEVVVLFDELDEFIGSRAELPDMAARLLTTCMLPLLQRFRSGADRVFFVATNYVKHVDSAARRIGRFDLVLPVGPPSLRDRSQLFQKAFRVGLPARATAGKLAKRRLEALSRRTKYFTYSEIDSITRSIINSVRNGVVFQRAADAVLDEIRLGQKSPFLKTEHVSGAVNTTLWEQFELDMDSYTRVAPYGALTSFR
jgi:SpoVK/Ycf46/Vps4 family AAA+-type ATPase